MQSLMHAASLWSAIAAGHLVSAIWQGTVLACAVAVCLRLLPRLSAAARSLVWMNVFGLLVLLHILPAFGGHAAAPGTAQVSRVDLDLRWSLAIVAVWTALGVWRGVQLAMSAIRLRGLVSRAIPLDADQAMRTLLVVGPGGRRAELCMSDEVARPSVFGFLRPRILLPPALVERLTEFELRQVVLHEMEHLRRADDWTNLVQKIALVLFPLNPALLWVEHRLCAERELACDDRVLREGCGNKAYALCLTRLAEYSMIRRSLSLALGAWERRPELVRRVHRLLTNPDPAMSRLQGRIVTATLMVAVFAGAMTLSRSPQMVGFAPSHSLTLDVLADEAGPSSPMTPVNCRLGRSGEADGTAQAVQTMAEMNPRPVRVRPIHALATAKPGHRRAAPRQAAPAPDAPDEAWMVLTDWNEMAMPARAVLAVQVNSYGTYAAVRMKNGWLIVQI